MWLNADEMSTLGPKKLFLKRNQKQRYCCCWDGTWNDGCDVESEIISLL